jgi:hypothetical protein
VFGVSRLVCNLILRSADPQDADFMGILYGNTSGMQMLILNHDLWYHVIFAIALPLLLMSAVSGIAAYTGIQRPITEKPSG